MSLSVTLDVSDVDLIENRIRLKPTGKRTNRTLFMDEEAAHILRRWLRVREGINKKKDILIHQLMGKQNIPERCLSGGHKNAAARWACTIPIRSGRKISPHCCRHWFTTHLETGGDEARVHPGA